MYASKEARLYEVQGKTRDDGRIYDSYLCLKCGKYVAFLPTPSDKLCGSCGPLEYFEYIKVPETEAREAREAIQKARSLVEQFI